MDFRVHRCMLLVCMLTIIVHVGHASKLPSAYHVNSLRAHLSLDPEVYMNITELLTSKGYPCEEHTAKTADGYLLGLQRVPHGKDNRHLGANRPVVFLQHGLLSSADDWADNLVNQSFVFLLADAGFDVWLGNSRGDTYSLKHEKYKPSEKEFWNFSWDDMARYDLPASVSTALRVSGAADLVYVGYSQGTQIAFAQLSTDKELSKKIKLFVALAPVAYVGKLKSPIGKLAPYASEVQLLFDLLGVKDFMPSGPLFHWLAQNFCDKDIPDILCENVLFLFGGFDSQQMNASRIPVYVSHAPAGTSTKNIIHYAQSVLADTFQKFDYGPDENQKHYNQSTPPQFEPSQITVPVALYSGSNDWLADPEDVNRLVPELKTLVKHTVIPGWEHLDFIWAMNSPTACYNDVIDLIKQYNNIA